MPAKIKKLREGRWTTDLWYRWLRFWQVYRALATGSLGTAELLVGVFSLLVTLILSFAWAGSLLSTRFWWLAVASTILIASAIATGLWALRTMSPASYAQTTLGGRTASETLQLISLDVRDACKKFKKDAGPFLEASPPSLEKLRKNFAGSHSKLLRISALMDLASKQLDIPLHRLRELLLEYDPEMHRAHQRQFVQSVELRPLRDKLNLDHANAVDQGASNSYGRAKNRERGQAEILEYTGLHSSILRMAAVHSTAQATQEYARIVSHVANLAYEELNRVTTWNARERQMLDDAMRAMRFLARKQRTHPGFDLNETCVSMFKIATQFRPRSKDPSLQEKLERQHYALHQLGKSIDKSDDGLFLKDPTKEDTVKDADCTQMIKHLADLRDLWPYVITRLEDDRERIVKSFTEMYGAWCRNNLGRPNTLIVTHGFSTTVREVLKRGLPDPLAGAPCNPQNLPDIFVVGSGDPADLDSRLMMSALLEVATKARRFRKIASGNEKALVKLLEDDTKVMVVLGAEGFDRNGRVLHPRGFSEVESIKNSFGQDSAVSTVVVAEGYKFHENLLSNPQDYRHHLDRVQLYDPDVLDVIITTDVQSVPYDRRSTTSAQCPPQYDAPVARKPERRGARAPRNKHILRRPVSFSHDTHTKCVSSMFKLSY